MGRYTFDALRVFMPREQEVSDGPSWVILAEGLKCEAVEGMWKGAVFRLCDFSIFLFVVLSTWEKSLADRSRDL